MPLKKISAACVLCLTWAFLGAALTGCVSDGKPKPPPSLTPKLSPVTLKLVNPTLYAAPLYLEITAPDFKNTSLALDVSGLVIPYSIVNLYDKKGDHMAKLIISGIPRLSKYYVSEKFDRNGMMLLPLKGVSMTIFTQCFKGYSKLLGRDMTPADVKNVGHVTITVTFQAFNKGDEVPTIFTTEKFTMSGEDFEKKFYHYNPGLNPTN